MISAWPCIGGTLTEYLSRSPSASYPASSRINRNGGSRPFRVSASCTSFIVMKSPALVKYSTGSPFAAIGASFLGSMRMFASTVLVTHKSSILLSQSTKSAAIKPRSTATDSATKP